MYVPEPCRDSFDSGFETGRTVRMFLAEYHCSPTVLALYNPRITVKSLFPRHLFNQKQIQYYKESLR